eukprot:726867-Pleurochrysis_carterae.AAC.3
MMVGHTHKDIDALFRRIAKYWARMGMVSTPSATVHPLVEYVHDWSSFFSDHIYDHVEGITEAREFIIKERDDGGECDRCRTHIRDHKHVMGGNAITS